MNARSVAFEALRTIEHEGGYANLVVPKLLADSGLDTRDRGFVTELVYGSTRMRRACDFAVDRFLARPPEPELRTILRMGAYQLLFMRVPTHAAVGETVNLAVGKWKGVSNAVLRKVAGNPPVWPDLATELSYPDWIVERLTRELGADDARSTLVAMNQAAVVTTRDDGYIQDASSTWVADLVEARPGELVLDLCAAPGGKSTRLAAQGATVVAVDLHPYRARLVRQNAKRLQLDVMSIVADGTAAPFRPGSFDRVLLDAPCSGLGALRRRADARWRMTPNDIDELVVLQRRLLDAARVLIRPGGTLVYSVCTLTAAESIDLDDGSWPELAAPAEPWRPYGRGARVLPHDAGTDGMTILRWTRPS